MYSTDPAYNMQLELTQQLCSLLTLMISASAVLRAVLIAHFSMQAGAFEVQQQYKS
jgi:hypothetical protein